MKNFISTILVLLSFSLVVQSYEEIDYAKRLKESLNQNNLEMSASKIKIEALKLRNWASKDFFENEIQKFIEEDTVSFPKKNQVLFVGSSSIRFWLSLKQDMEPISVINRGFGGSQIVHVNNSFDEIVAPYNPKAIVFYCGSNDLAGLKEPKEVFNEFKVFYEEVRSRLPSTKVFVIGIKPSPSREYQEDKQIRWNNMISDLAIKENNLFFLDVWPAMLMENGKADPSLFIKDMLHMNKKGYEVWTGIVKPALLDQL